MSIYEYQDLIQEQLDRLECGLFHYPVTGFWTKIEGDQIRIGDDYHNTIVEPESLLKGLENIDITYCLPDFERIWDLIGDSEL